MSALQSGFTENCEIVTSEAILSHSGELPLEGVYAFATLEEASSFFSSSYDADMLREGHGTRILSIVAFRLAQQ